MSFLKSLFGNETTGNNLRIIITRHGERADLALGQEWISKMQRTGAHDPRISYLVPRADIREWDFDPPLTLIGERQSMSIGRKLYGLDCAIDYCYSSPAYRSIQTASKILESQGRKNVPIQIEPGLFECPSWYAGTPILFVPPEELAMDRHFNIDPYYSPFYDIDLTEDELGYYKRSRYLIDKIVKLHKDRGGNILLSGHAGSIETVTRGAVRRRARPERLEYEANKVNYCNFAILERNARTKQWTMHSPSSSEQPHGGQGPIQSSIPLYSATSHYNLMPKYLRHSLIIDRSYRLPYRYHHHHYHRHR